MISCLNKVRCLPTRPLLACTLAMGSVFAPGLFAQSTATSKSSSKKAPSNQRSLTLEDVVKMWKTGDDLLLTNQIRLRKLAFAPEEDWVMNQLPALTGVPLSQMPKAAAALKATIEPGPEVDAVAAAAPALLDKVKAAAQKRSASEMDPLIHPELAKDKSRVYDLFDLSNYRGHTLGRFAQEPNREVSVQFFELTSSQVERVHYVYFSMLHGKVVLRDVKSGPEEAERFLHDEERLAQDKLQIMFRALNDGDESGVKMLCTDGLYQSIKDWGGDKHPGDRLTRGRKLEQVSVKTSVPLDQKSVRVVARISYPLNANKTVAFDCDFERIGNDLKIVRVRDTENKLVVFDPDVDNYLNRRFGLPDGPKIDINTAAMSDQEIFLSLHQLQDRALRALEDHNAQRIKELAQAVIESDPTGGDGYGVRAGADQILKNYDDAERDASRALEHSGTVYFAVQRHAGFQSEPFTPALLGISKKRIEYRPAAGRGAAEDIDMSNLTAKIDIGQKSIFKGLVKSDRPFLAITFSGADGKKKTYNFAATGTQCQPGPDLTSIGAAGGVCGIQPSAVPTNARTITIFDPNAKALPLYVPRDWQRDLTAVLRAIQQAKGGK